MRNAKICPPWKPSATRSAPYNFAAQYQQRPETPEGSLIKRKYIQVIAPVARDPPGGRALGQH